MWHLFARDSKNVVYESRGAEKPFLFLTWDAGHLPRPGNQEATEDKTNKTKKRKRRGCLSQAMHTWNTFVLNMRTIFKTISSSNNGKDVLVPEHNI